MGKQVDHPFGPYNMTINVSDIKSFFQDLGKTNLDANTIALMTLYVPVFFLGFVGNILITIIVCSNKRLRNSTNLYLCNMAIADLCVSLICVPMAVGQALYRVWLYGEFMCKITTYLQCVTVSASIYTITILSVDRFLAIKQPIVFRKIINLSVAGKLIALVWTVSMVIMGPLLFTKRVDSVTVLPGHPVLYLCNEIWPSPTHRQVYDVILFVCVYIVPGFIISTCYGLIGCELFREDKGTKNSVEMNRGVGKQIMHNRKRVARMLVALALLFAICWLPYYVVSLYLDFQRRHDQKFLTALPFTILLGHSNSALNPLLYFYSSKSFRIYLMRTLTCKKPSTTRNFAVRYTNLHRCQPEQEVDKPKIRVISYSNLTRTRSGETTKWSLTNGSRSSNTSLRSSGTTSKSREFSKEKTIHREKCKMKVDPSLLDSKKSPDQKTNNIYETINTIVYARKREMLDKTLNIPTTINEESTKMGSVCSKRHFLLPSDIHCIPEIIEE